MRRSLIRGASVIDKSPDILFKVNSTAFTGFVVKGVDIVIKEESSGHLLWSCEGYGVLSSSQILYASNANIDIRLTAKKLEKIQFGYSLTTIKYFRVNSTCNITSCFYACTNLTTVLDFNVDNVNNLYRLFHTCYQLINIEPFYIKEGSNLRESFSNCSLLLSCPILNIEVANNLTACFNSSGLNNLTNLEYKEFEAVMSGNFLSYTKLVEVRNLTFKNSTDFSLSTCSLLTLVNNINLPRVQMVTISYNPSLVTVTNLNMPACTSLKFTSCTALTTVENITISPNYTNGAGMFLYCSSLTSAPVLDYSKIESADGMFYNCTALTDISNFNSNVLINTSDMFYNCSSLTSLPDINYSNIYQCYQMFRGCNGLSGAITLTLPKASNMHSMFLGCSNITSIVLNLGYSSFIPMQNIFSSCSSLENVTINAIDNIQLEYGIQLGFANCTSLATVTLPYTEKYCIYRYAFGGCTTLTAIPTNLSSYGNYNYTFMNCTSLTEVKNRTFNHFVNSTYSEPANFVGTFSGAGITTIENVSLRGYKNSAAYDTNFHIAAIFQNCPIDTVTNLTMRIEDSVSTKYEIRKIFNFAGAEFERSSGIIDVVPNSNRDLICNGLLSGVGVEHYNDDIDISKFNTLRVFESDTTIKTINLTINMEARGNKIGFSGFSNCYYLESIVINNPNNYKLTPYYINNQYINSLLSGLPKLTNVIIPGLAQTVSLPESVTDINVIENFIDAVADVTNEGFPLYITIGPTRLSQIQQSVIDNATSKNWIIQ